MFCEPQPKLGVKLLLKNGVLSSKLLKPPHVVMRPQGVTQTINKSLISKPNLPTQLRQIAKGHILKLDHPDLTTELYRASHRGPQRNRGHWKKNRLEWHQSCHAMCSTGSAIMLKNIYVVIWMRDTHQCPQRRTMCQHSP